VTALTDTDRRRIAQARTLAEAGVEGSDAIREHLTARGLLEPGDETLTTYPFAFGVARELLADLAAIAERLGGAGDQAAEDTRRLGEVRALLAAFDWEHDDRQYALERIEMIVAVDDQEDEPEP
jgi:hypothetical protein